MNKVIFFIALIFSLSAATFAQQVGKASYYSSKLTGRHTSDGGKYHPDSMTCAHRTFPLGTYLKVRNPKNNAEVIVKVTDRGPHQNRLMIDLSYLAASTLDIIRTGIATVEITGLDSNPFVGFNLVCLPIPLSGLIVNSVFPSNSPSDYLKK